jgi:predicted Zn-dependent protease
MMMLTLAPGTSLQEAASSILQKYSLQLVESKEVNVNGLNALAMVADQKPQQDQQQAQSQTPVIRTLSYVIQHENNLYHLIGVAEAPNFTAYSPYFSQTMQNFRTLTDPDKLNRKPERVRLKTVNQNITLEKALRGFGVPDKKLDEAAILNGMKLNETVSAGTIIKIIAQ